jgi:hypothetical protein
VDLDDRDAWLAIAGAANLPSGSPYLLGDANLNGVVDFLDFNIWAANRFTNNAAWSKGDFNASGVVDFLDFNIWAANRFQSAAVLATAPTGTTVLNAAMQTPGTRSAAGHQRSAAGRTGNDHEARGVTDGQDFIIWNDNKFTRSERMMRSAIAARETCQEIDENGGLQLAIDALFSQHPMLSLTPSGR